MRLHIVHPLCGILDIADPTSVPVSMAPRIETACVASAKEPLATKLLGQMKWMSVWQNPARRARAGPFGLEINDAVARHSAPKTLAA